MITRSMHGGWKHMALHAGSFERNIQRDSNVFFHVGTDVLGPILVLFSAKIHPELIVPWKSTAMCVAVFHHMHLGSS